MAIGRLPLPLSLVISTTQVTRGFAAPDGVKRGAILINGAFLGPLINVSVGDRIIIVLRNLLEEPVSIHWSVDGCHHSEAGLPPVPLTLPVNVGEGESITLLSSLGLSFQKKMQDFGC